MILPISEAKEIAFSCTWRDKTIVTYLGLVIAEITPVRDRYLVLLDNRVLVLLNPEDRVELVLNREETK